MNLEYTQSKTVDVSVIIPHYNSLDTLVRAILSVINQTCMPKEIIVVDDGSANSDEVEAHLSNEFKELIADKTLILYMMKKNQGVSVARNKGIEIAQGEYIAFLDSDDVWHEQKLDIQYNLMEKEKIDFSYHTYIPKLPESGKVNLANESLNSISVNLINKYIFIITNPIATPTVMITRTKIIKFDAGLVRMEDFQCWVKNSTQFNFYKIELPLAGGFKPPIGSDGLSANVTKMHKGLILALAKLYKEGYISIVFLVLAVIIEYIKYPLRRIRLFYNGY